MDYRMDYPAADNRPVMEGHAKACRQHGHATHIVDGIDQGFCPRCGSTVDTARLTPLGLECMTAIGRRQTSFFDEGIVEGSGIWETCLMEELDHKSSGVINQLVKLGLLTSHCYSGDDESWVALTAQGAELARSLDDRKPVCECGNKYRLCHPDA